MKKKKTEKKEKKDSSIKQISSSLVSKKRKKEEEYILKSDTKMRVARIFLWVILVFFFIRGIVTTLKPDQKSEVTEIIEKFEKEYGAYQATNEGILGFAQNFVREYMTYNNQYEEEYKERIKPYVSKELLNLSGICDFNGNAEVTYVEAYRKEEYAENQFDVYVVADVKYEMLTPSEDGETFDTLEEIGKVTVKVPIYAKNGKYLIEDIPVFTNDKTQLSGYETNKYEGEMVEEASEKSAIQEALKNFLKAYYQDKQSVVDYYLGEQADKGKFQGLNGRFQFETIEKLDCYQTGNGILAAVTMKVKDNINGAYMLQRINILLSKNGERYYVLDMNTKTKNMKER